MEIVSILVVEDDPLIRSLVEDILSDGGFAASSVATGEEALMLLQGEGKYRALVTDTNLGETMDGWEVAQHAREVEPDFPIVYMSGAVATDWASKGVPHSIMLSKPFASAQLVTAISNLLNSLKQTSI